MAEKEYLATRLFKDRSSAEQEYEALIARDYSPKEVNVIMTEEGRKRHFGMIVAGPIAAALAGAGAGAVAGGAIGALVGAGIPEERVKEYESGLKDGYRHGGEAANPGRPRVF
jgi:hypothetical protein